MNNLKVKVLMYNNEFADIQPNGNIIKIPFPKIFNNRQPGHNERNGKPDEEAERRRSSTKGVL